ncbi:MAG: sugar phosphate isomerase/epimerase family protein [Planctomycetota bacterium]|jgi:sugar phosphate isomerase/epimerase
MTLRRRDLLAATAASAAGIGAMGRQALAGEKCTAPIKPKKKAVLKLSSQLRPMAGEGLAEKLDNMEKWGFVGLELYGGELLGEKISKKVNKYKNALKGRPIKISAICAGNKGCIITKDKPDRDLAMKTIKQILTAAGELESTGMILVPAFHWHKTALPNKEARPILIEALKEIGEHAASAGTRILLEPLNRKECFFLRQLADAAAICKDVDKPGVCMMGDFWHMTWEETSDLGAFISAGDYLHHVHIASRKERKMPGEDGEADNYVLGFKGLKWIGYQDYVSLECGAKGDRNVVVPKAAELLREQWEQA